MTDDAPTVLVVDDEPAVTEVYATHLRDEYQVRTAKNGEEALAEMDEDVSVVLLDRRMPGMSGDEVLEHIREEGYEARVAMVTAVDPDFDIIDMGFDDYLVKPVSRADLYDTVETLLTHAGYDDTMQEYFALVSKQAVLQSNMSETDLSTNEEYAELEARIEELNDELDEATTEFEEDDFAAAFRDIGDDMELDADIDPPN
jgi:DNA-binding response OmpR family regulator